MNQTEQSLRAMRGSLLLGIVAAALFSVSFVLNRMMSAADGHWAWSASLRFLLMMPLLLVYLRITGKWSQFCRLWKQSPGAWIIWGGLGCGVFYATLTAACALSPAYVVAATWPIAIVIGILLSPWLYRDERKRIPRQALLFSSVIVVGVVLLQAGEFRKGNINDVVTGIILVLISATAHPIGNRKSMDLCVSSGEKVDAVVRLCLMIAGSIPLLLVLCLWGGLQAGMPAAGQWSTLGIVALTGLCATPLFYAATDRVNHHGPALAAVEATQALEILFTLLLEAWLLGIVMPDGVAIVGLCLIICGIILHAQPHRLIGKKIPPTP